MIYVISILSLAQIIFISILMYQQRVHRKRLQLILQYQQLLLIHSQFGNDAHEMLLWKDRCDIIKWQKELILMENYEMANETKKATERIANMINYYRDNLQTHENN